MRDKFPTPDESLGPIAGPENENSLFRTINAFAVRLLTIPTQADLVWYVAREVIGRLGFDDCVIYLVDPARNLLRQVAAIGTKNPHGNLIVNALEIPIGDGITGHVASTRQPLIVDNLAEDGRYIADVEPALSEICVPLIIDDAVVGVIDCEDPRPSHFGHDHLEILTTISAMTSAKLKLLNETRRVEERTDELRQLNDRLQNEIEDHNCAEEVLKESEERLQGILDHMMDTYYRTDAAGRIEMASASATNLLGYSIDELIGQNLAELYDVGIDREVFLQELKKSGGSIEDYETALRRKDGRTIWVSTNARLLRDTDGQIIGVEGTTRDITHRKQTEQALRESEQLFRSVVEGAPMSFQLKDMDGLIQLVNKRYEEWFGVSSKEVVGKPVTNNYSEALVKSLAAQDRETLRSMAPVEREQSIEFADGSTHIVALTKFPILDEESRPVGIGTIGVDVTEHRRTEERLAQAQKMEAVGQLTGGVAHDFNNLLAVIQGNAELLADEGGATVVSHSQSILRASARGAELTRHLLAFSRKQSLRPQPIDLAALMDRMSGLLERTLGATIEVQVTTEPDLWSALADPGQVENAILNLAINARDAMTEGGKLAIRCANARLDEAYLSLNPEAAMGEYVLISVNDTGVGMSDEDRTHAFEPFFTTKEVGKGSGLGLSMVYGFAKQSGGHVIIGSELGEGTTVTVYLPRNRRPAPSAGDIDATARDIPSGQGEAILVIEDNADVRALAVQMLTSLGYRVIDVPGVAGAREVLASGQKVDLMLSDVILPGGMSGPQFAEEACAGDPGLKVVFMSGYPAEPAKSDGSFAANKVMLNKPFRKRQLAKALRQALD